MPKILNKKTAVLTAILALSVGATAMAESFIHPSKEVNVSAPSHSSNLISRGVFKAHAEQGLSGEAFILQTPRDYVLVLSQDFSLEQSQLAEQSQLVEQSQSAVLAFGHEGTFIQGSQFADLRASSGRQTYILPKTFNPSYVNEIYIVSKASSEPLTMVVLNDLNLEV